MLLFYSLHPGDNYCYCYLDVKGEVRRFLLSDQSLYPPQTKTSLDRPFSPKNTKVVQKSVQSQRVQNLPNKDQVADRSKSLGQLPQDGALGRC